MPLISVITPVFNKEKYVSNAIESVLQQTYDSFEYIIIDDGSTDRSSSIVDEYAKKDKRIKVFHQENQWIFASYNNGIKKASGEYIYILNSDDLLRKNALQLMAEKVNQFRPDVIWTKVLSHKADIEQNILEYDYAHLDDRVSEDSFQNNREEFKKQWLFLNESLMTLNQANLYKRELMLRHPFRNDVYGADTLINFAIADDISSSYVLSEPVYDFFEYSNFQNASAGKYHDYEHNMFNDMYLDHKKLLQKWRVTDKSVWNYVCQKRLRDFSVELKNYKYCKTLTTDEKIHKILTDFSDNILYECAQYLDAYPELERRLLFGLKNIIENEGINKKSEFYYLQNLLDLFEAQQNIIKNAQEIMDDSKSRYNIGSCFVKLLCEGEVGSYLNYFYGRHT